MGRMEIQTETYMAFFLINTFIACVCMCLYPIVQTWMSEYNFWSWFSFIMWAPGIKLKSSYLVTSIFTHRAHISGPPCEVFKKSNIDYHQTVLNAVEVVIVYLSLHNLVEFQSPEYLLIMKLS